MLAAAVITTFPSVSWDIYAKRMLESFVAYWPKEIPLLVQLDDDLLVPSVNKIIRDGDGLNVGWTKDHADFVKRNKDKDSKDDYRKQAVRFCHKVFALKFACDSAMKARTGGAADAPRYLIWLDADVLTTKPVTIEDIQKCLPKEGDAVSYLGRKDWPHSECGWLVFDLENGGDSFINILHQYYLGDEVFKQEQWHDSWIFDQVRNATNAKTATNLTPNATGMEVWPQSPMASWSRHYKGPIAKEELAGITPKKEEGKPLVIRTQNSLPDTSIHANILENQTLIKQWVTTCLPCDEEIVVVSGGPMLIAEDLLEEQEKGHKIVAVKHALTRLKDVGVQPWAVILLDPREHVYDFVSNPDKDVIWFVASQVTPKVTRKLLEAGCNVWGYHASVGADESKYTNAQSYAVVDGGSATATRGLYLLEKLGFHRFRLYGYDLCLEDKPDLSLRDERGQPKHFEVSIDSKFAYHKGKRSFWSTGELLAQAEELKKTLDHKKWQVRAFGPGIGDFIANSKRISDLREARKNAKLGIKPVTLEDMLCRNKIPLSALWRRLQPRILRKRIKANSF